MSNGNEAVANASRAMRWLLAWFAAAIAGCASGPQFRELGALPENEGQIVLYRASALLHGGAAWRVDLNGRQAAVLRNGGYAVVQVPPGAYVLELGAHSSWSSFNQVALPIAVAANSRVFVRAGVQLTGVLPLPLVGGVQVAHTLVVVPPEAALPALQTLRLSE